MHRAVHLHHPLTLDPEGLSARGLDIKLQSETPVRTITGFYVMGINTRTQDPPPPAPFPIQFVLFALTPLLDPTPA